jgi:hypothetical protein
MSESQSSRRELYNRRATQLAEVGSAANRAVIVGSWGGAYEEQSRPLPRRCWRAEEQKQSTAELRRWDSGRKPDSPASMTHAAFPSDSPGPTKEAWHEQG